jgi:hypothetical protein
LRPPSAQLIIITADEWDSSSFFKNREKSGKTAWRRARAGAATEKMAAAEFLVAGARAICGLSL